MKKVLLVIAGTIFCLTAGLSNVFAEEKYAYVELGKIFNEYNKTKDYDKNLGDKEASYNKERDKKIEELKQIQDKMSLLSEKEKELKGRELENKAKAFEELDRQKQLELRQEFNQKKAEILKDIENTIKQYAAKEGYTYIFNEVGVVYHNPKTNITDSILVLLNKPGKGK